MLFSQFFCLQQKGNQDQVCYQDSALAIYWRKKLYEVLFRSLWQWILFPKSRYAPARAVTGERRVLACWCKTGWITQVTFGDMVRGLCNNMFPVSIAVQTDRRQEEGRGGIVLLSLNFSTVIGQWELTQVHYRGVSLGPVHKGVECTMDFT